MADSSVPITPGTGANVDTRTNTAAEHRQVVVLGEGAALSDLVNPFRPDAYLRVAQDGGPLLFDTFDAALDTTDRWTTGGTVPTSATGVLTVSAGTTALAVSSLTSKPTLPLLINMFVTPNALIATEAGLKTGAYRFVGLGVAAGSPTVAAPITNGVGFEWIDTTGVLSGVVWSGGTRAQSVSLSTVQPSDAAYHRYLCYFKSSKVYFEIDGVTVANIAYPAPQVSNLPMLMMAVNGASTVSPAAVFTASFLGVADSGHNSNALSDASFPWRKATIKAPSVAAVATDPALVVAVSPNNGVAIAAAQTLATVSTVTAVTAITNALPVGANVVGKVGIDQTTPGTTNAVNATPVTPTAFLLDSAATTNATSIKGSAGTVYQITCTNQHATLARSVKLYNKASAPTVGTDVPVLTIAVPFGSTTVANIASANFGALGLRLGTGIGLAITAVATVADATAVALHDVQVAISYI